MKKNRMIITILLLGFAFVINYMINFFLTSYVTVQFGTAEYGYISLAKTIATYVVIITTALDSYASRYISFEYHKNNMELANIYFNSVFFADAFMGSIIIALSILFVSVINVFLRVPKNIIFDIRMLFICVFLNLAISLLSTAFQSSAIIKDKLRESSFFKLMSYLTEALTLVLLYNILTPRLYFVGIGLIVATLVILISSCYITKKYTPEIKINREKFSFNVVKKLVIEGVWNSLNSLGNMLNSGLDLVVTNILLGSIAMGQVSIVKTMTNIFACLYQIVTQPFQPTLIKDYVDSNKDKLMYDLKISMKITGYISNIAFAGVIGFGLQYYKLWVPNQDCELLYKLTVIATATSILEGVVSPLYYIYTLTVKNKFPCIITIVGGVINVLAMYFLIPHFSQGIYIVFLTTAIVMLTINGITNPIYMAKCLKIRWFSFYPVIFRHLISGVIMTLVITVLANYVIVNSWISLIFWAIVSSLLGLIIHIVIMIDRNDIDKLKQNKGLEILQNRRNNS